MPEMMNITVRNKIATKTDNVAYVCGNSDYVINFDFDSEWDAYDTKTARFAHDGQHTDVVFAGNQCNVPIITNTYAFHVGVFAGDLHTTTAARVPCRKSILCGSGAPADPTPDVYDQLMERMAQLETSDWNQNDPTSKDYIKNRTHWVDDDGTVHKLDEKFLPDSSAVSFAAQSLTDSQKAQARENIGAQEWICSSKEIPEETIANFVVQSGQFSPNFNFSKSLEVGKTYKVYNNDSFIESTASEFNGNIQLSITNGVISHPIGKPEEGFYNGAPTNFGEYSVCVPAHDVVHTIDPKYIKDMYYSEIAETIIGYGMNGWAVTTKNEAVPIPKMAIRGKVYENVPVDHTQMANVVYVVGGYTLTFNRMNNYMTADPSDLSSADVAFYGQGTVYHQMPAWAANLGGQGIYVADTTGSPMVMLDKMPEDCHFVVAINLSPSFSVETVRYRGEDSPIISCKTQKQITNNAIPKYAMLLALTDDGWICVNPIA